MVLKEKKQEGSGERFRWFQIEILVVFTAIILIVTVFLDYLILTRSGRVMQQTVSDLIAANSRQIELNINSYLERMETISTLLFSDESYYLYDSTDETIEAYEKVKCEDSIEDRIVDIGLMENYSDFGIIYSDDHKVGWISHGTEDLFPDGVMYEAFSQYIINDRKNDGWCFGINGSTDRMYYIKRLNANAILVSAIYTRELSSVFIYPEQLDEMTIRLVDKDNTIMFSSFEDEIGGKLPDEIARGMSKADPNGQKPDTSNVGIDMSSSIINEDYIINSNLCSNNWKVICSVPTNIILEENVKLKNFTLRVSVAMAVLFVLIGLVLITKLARPMDGMVTSLQEKAEIDRLSGVMNKSTFQETVEKKLADKDGGKIPVMVMLDVDNFKQINDNFGHMYGDQVIIRVGKLLKRMYDDKALIGRLGGDEFAAYMEYNGISREDVIVKVKDLMDNIIGSFTAEFEYEREQCNVSLSAGVLVSDKDVAFDELYEYADKALYTSKRNGKSQYTFYDEKAGNK